MNTVEVINPPETKINHRIGDIFTDAQGCFYMLVQVNNNSMPLRRGFNFILLSDGNRLTWDHPSIEDLIKNCQELTYVGRNAKITIEF
jgi:hypothetical protein